MRKGWQMRRNEYAYCEKNVYLKPYCQESKSRRIMPKEQSPFYFSFKYIVVMASVVKQS